MSVGLYGAEYFSTSNFPGSAKRARTNYRVTPSTTFVPGYAVALASMDLQVFDDIKTVGLPAATAALGQIMGIIPVDWEGFDGNGSSQGGAPVASSYVASNASAARDSNSQTVPVVFSGSTLCWVDQSGGAATTITDGTPMVTSSVTPGYLQGETGTDFRVGFAKLPASGLASSLTAAALAQGTQTQTITSAASGETVGTTFQIPYSSANPLVAPSTVQTRTVSIVLNSTTGASVTAAATALKNALNADPIYSLYYVASSSAGVVTNTVLGTGIFTLNFANGGSMKFTLTGSAANGATFASVTGGGSAITNSGNISGGTGYLGICPIWVSGLV